MQAANENITAVDHVQVVSESKLSFEKMWERHDLSDVTLCCDQREFRVHRFLLAACSPYFRSTFQMHPSKKLNIIIKNVRSDDLENVLLYMYRGSIVIKQEAIQGFCELLEMFQMSLPDEIVVSSDSEADPENDGNKRFFEQMPDKIDFINMVIFLSVGIPFR